jgi:flagellar biogenesis protein FliO
VEPDNQSELTAGTALHRQHGRKVLAAGLLRTFGLLLLLLAFTLLTAYLVTSLLH